MRVPVSMLPDSPAGIGAGIVAVLLLGLAIYAARKAPTPPVLTGYPGRPGQPQQPFA